MAENQNLTIGQLFELNQSKNPSQNADTEGRFRQAAKSLGLDPNTIYEEPKTVIETADELSQEQRFERFMQNDPAIRKFAENPSNATLAVDDLDGLSNISSGIKSLNKKFSNGEKISDEELSSIARKGTSTAQREKSRQYYKKLGIDVDPPKPVKSKVPSVLAQMVDASPVPLTFEQQVDQEAQKIFDEHGALAAAQYRQAIKQQTAWDDFYGGKAWTNTDPNNQPNNDYQIPKGVGRGFLGLGQSMWGAYGAGAQWLADNSPVLSTFNQAQADFAFNIFGNTERIKNQYIGQSSDYTYAMAQASSASQQGVLNGASELIRQMYNNPMVGAELLAEQVPSALVGFGAGSALARIGTTPLIRSVSKTAPYFMRMERAGKVAKAVSFIGAGVEGASGAFLADAGVSYGANLAQAQEKLITRAEQIDYANAKTWGSAKYSALGGALLPVRFGGALRTTVGQSVIQGAAGIASVYGGADAVGEEADPLEVALEGVFGAVTAIPEVAIVTANKVKNRNTAIIALDQVYQQQAESGAKAYGFGGLVGNLVENIKGSKTLERDPSAVSDFIKGAVAEHGATDEVFIDGQTFNQLLQERGIDAADLFERAPSLSEQLGDAQAFQGSVRMPIDEFAMALSEFDDPLPFIDHVRASPDAMTIAEAETLQNKTTAEMRQEADAFMAEQAKFESAEEARDVVRKTILDQLSSLKQFNKDYNQPASELATAFYTTLGEKLGMSAKQAFDQYPINIMGEMDGRSSYEQSALEQKESDAIRQQYQDTDQWLKAPNGQNTKLTEQQWVQVRTPSFKQWFGDWEGDPDNASKVVDDNGEPLMVYHGTDADFSEFKEFDGIYFSPTLEQAERYKRGGKIMPVYLKAENLFDTRKPEHRKIFQEKFLNKWGNGTPLNEQGLPDWVESHDFKEFFEDEGLDFDGAVIGEPPSVIDGGYRSELSYMGFNANQIKSATDNEGTFDPSNANIYKQSKSGVQSLDDFEKQAKEIGVAVSVYEKGDVITLSKIVVPQNERGTGKGSKLMRQLIDYADANSKHIELTPSGDFGGNVSKLKAFYKKFGFVENKGKNKVFQISEAMYREAADKTLYQGGVRGAINFKQGQDGSTIVLGKNADFSTFVHELGHHFLEMNMQIALKPDAPVQIRQDMETLLKWADSDIQDIAEWDFLTQDEKTEVHEKFAESFEQYVYTGKSPSAELKQVFRRFRQFMIAVYRNIEKFLGINSRAELNPDITGVMDRMLASDSAIKEAEAANSLEMLISQDDAMRLGISPKAYDEMRQEHEDATEFATNTLEQKAVRDLSWYQKQRSKYIKTLQREASRKRAEIRSQVADDVAQEPVYKAMAFLRQPMDAVKKKGTALDTTVDTLFEAIAKLGGLDASEIEATWGVDQAAKIKSGVSNTPLARSSRAKTAGLSIEHMAERLAEEGYLSVDEHGKFDTRELEDKFHDELIGIKHYSTNADPEMIMHAEEMDLLQAIEHGSVTKAKLSLDWIYAKYGEDSVIAQSIPKGAYGLAQKGGENPDLIAEAFGFESGDAMIRALLEAVPPKQRIDELTDMRMAAEHAEFFDEQSIVEAVESALHNDIRARLIASQVAALNNMMGRKAALNDAAKNVAQDIIDRQALRDIRPHMRARDDARLGREADKAMKNNDLVGAARLKRNQLVQFHATKYSYDAKASIDKKMQLVKKIFGNDAKLAKNRDFDLVTAARGVLARYNLAPKSSKYEGQLEKIRELDPTTYADIQNIGTLPDAKDVQDLTFEEFKAVMSAVETLWHRSKENNLWYTTEEALEREQVRDDLIAQSAKKKSIAKLNEQLLGRLDLVGQLKVDGLGILASMRRVDQVVTWLDGGRNGVFRKYLVNPIQDALANYRIDKTKMLKDVEEIFSEFGTLDTAKIHAPELKGQTFKGKQALIHAVLYTGNMSNKERLVLGYGWGERLEDGSVDFGAWDQFFRRMIAEGVITKKDMDTVQKLWDTFDSYKNDAQRTHKRINGYYFEELPSMALDTPFGEYRGGYVPAIYDPVRSDEADRRDAKSVAENDLKAMNVATTGASFTKSRADRFHDTLIFDLSKLPSALDKELRYIHLELPVRQAGRMLMNKQFASELERVMPYSVKEIFTPWLKAVVNQRLDDTANPSRADKIWQAMRRNTGIAIMAGNVKNAVEQISGFTQVMAVIPAKHLIKAQADFAKSLVTRQKMADEILELSDFMRTRWDRAADEYRYAIDDVIVNKNKYQSVRDFTMRHAYILQTTIQKPMEVISWQAAFEHHIAQGMNQYDAVRASDAVIREVMNDMSPEGVSNLERGSPAKRMFLMFYNWFNMVWNTASTEMKLAIEQNNGSWVKASPRLAYIAMMMVAVPAMFSEIIGIAFSGGLEDEDDDGNKWDDLSGRLALSQVKMASAFVPYGGNFANSLIARTDDNVMNDRYTASPIFSMFDGIGSLVDHANRAWDEDKEVNRGRVAKDMLTSATFATGIPFSTLGKPSNYWLQIEQGKKDEPENTLDAVRGTITGKHAPVE